MFEKEAKERARELEESQTLGIYYDDESYARDLGWNEGEVAGYEEGFKDGAEFGYNKAFVEADKNLKAIVKDFNKAKELEKENAEMNKQLTKAKEIIKYLCGMVRELNKPNVQLTDVDCSLSEAEQFVSKVEQ